MKVLFAASECAPIFKAGGLADVVGSLPKALAKRGVEVAIILPKYSLVGAHYPKLLPGTKIPIFYVENDEYFHSPEIYPGGEVEHQRFAYFSRVVCEFLDTRVFEPEVIHCHDYHTALIPDILKSQRKKVATILTIHDLSNTGESSPSILDTSLLSGSHLRMIDYDLTDRSISMLLQGVLSADLITTVSPTYSREILTKEYGAGLDEVLKAREARLYGVLNGVDVDEFNPKNDKSLVKNYFLSEGATSIREVIEAKSANKAALQKRLNLKVDPNVPLVGLVSRLVERKGISLVAEAIPSLTKEEVQFVVLGQGDSELERRLGDLCLEHPGQVSVRLSFDEHLSRLIYAASDLFLVPSRFEPCGLTQMIAMRYGAVPIVTETGGLADTVFPGVNGFTLSEYSSRALEESLRLAVATYREGNLHSLILKSMGGDYSWDRPSLSYLKLYQKALAYKFGIPRGVGGEVRVGFFGEWAILSPGRSDRPNGNSKTKNKRILNSETYNRKDELDHCPFEMGREDRSPGETFRVGSGLPDSPGWQTRVVPNKYPILPSHEIIIHNADHFKMTKDYSYQEVQDLIWTYLSRYRHFDDFGYVHIFCNSGKEAGASQRHPHSQLIVLDEMTKATLETIEASADFYLKHRLCPYCQQLKREVSGPRIIWENDSMVLLTPFATDWPYEMVVIPKTHRKSFANINEKEIRDLAEILRDSLKALDKEIPGVSYNYWIHSLPSFIGLDKIALYYHWHLDIIPRVKVLGGVELGLKLMVDDRLSPEKTARVLRGHFLKVRKNF